jgi:hypothetical protein
MNDTGKSYFSGYEDAKHKPRIGKAKFDDHECFKCYDGGLEQYGDTSEEAYNNLMKLRN